LHRRWIFWGSTTDGTVLFEYSPRFPSQTPNVSYGINSGGLLRFFSTPTPGSASGVGDNSSYSHSPHCK
jgi:hypothetical protein